MTDRRVLNTWKEIASHLSRGVRTAQRWERNYRLPVYRPNDDAQSVYAFADEIDAWMQRSKPKGEPYLRTTVIVLDAMTPGALSDLKLAIEGAKFNVLTGFTATEVLACAAKYDVDGFVIDSVMLDADPGVLGRDLRRLHPAKPRLLVGDEYGEEYDATVLPGDTAAVVKWLVERFGRPKID